MPTGWPIPPEMDSRFDSVIGLIEVWEEIAEEQARKQKEAEIKTENKSLLLATGREFVDIDNLRQQEPHRIVKTLEQMDADEQRWRERGRERGRRRYWEKKNAAKNSQG